MDNNKTNKSNPNETKSSVIVHKRSHSSERPYKCDICLKRHMLVHSGKKDAMFVENITFETVI